MKPGPFEYHAPTSVDDAVGLLSELGDVAKVIAGGQSLVPMLALRLARFGHLVDIGRIGELRGIERRNGAMLVRATTRDAVIERNAEVARDVPLLALVTPLIGHFQIRNRGTVGGSIAHADPAAESPAVALALDAQIDLVSTSGARTVPAGEFFTGNWATCMEPDELLTGVHFPVWDGRCGFGVAEFARRHGDFAIAGAVVGVGLGGDGTIERCAIGLFGVGPTPVRARDAEGQLLGSAPGAPSADEVAALALAGVDDLPDDLHAPAEYRRRVAVAMVASAWSRAMKEARDH